jgi:hypothetical protein
MANRKFFVGMMVMVLTFGMMVVGCDNGTNNGNENGDGTNPFIGGTWTAIDASNGNTTVTLLFNSSSTVQWTESPPGYSFSMSYTSSGNSGEITGPDGAKMAMSISDGLLTVQGISKAHGPLTFTKA